MKILITEKVDNSLEIKLTNAGFICNYYPDITFEELKNIISGYEGLIIRSKFSIDKNLIDKAENLKFIGRLGAGMENIDVEYAENKNIKCINSPEGNRDAVGEHAVGMLISLMHNISKADKEVKAGLWQRNPNRGYEIQGKTIGIIGYGNMGKSFARRISGFDVKVMFYDINRKLNSDKYAVKASMQEIYEQADILSLHVPLTKKTEFLVNSKFISNFKKSFYLINTARGQVVNTKDVVTGLKNDKILGVALDVLEYENKSFENLYNKEIPEELEYIINSDKAILTPHIAGRTFEAEKKLSEHIVRKIMSSNFLIS